MDESELERWAETNSREISRFGPIRRTHSIVLQYIDSVKHRHDQSDYPFSSKAIKATLTMLISQYNLSFRNIRGILKPCTPNSLCWYMAQNLVGPQGKGVPSKHLWTRGTDCLSKTYIDMMHGSAKIYSKEVSGPSFGDFPIPDNLADIERELERMQSSEDPYSSSVEQLKDSLEHDSALHDRSERHAGQQHALAASEVSGYAVPQLLQRASNSQLQINEASELPLDSHTPRSKPSKKRAVVDLSNDTVEFQPLEQDWPRLQPRPKRRKSVQLSQSPSSTKFLESLTESVNQGTAKADALSPTVDASEHERDSTSGSSTQSTNSITFANEMQIPDSQGDTYTSSSSPQAEQSADIGGSALGKQPCRDTLLPAHADASKSRDMGLNVTTNASVTKPAPELKNLKPALNDICHAVRATVSSIFVQIGLLEGQNSPYSADMEGDLLHLFKLCFGEDWLSVCGRLYKLQRCSASDLVHALIAGFLFREVWAGGFGWMIDICESATIDMTATTTNNTSVDSIVPGLSEFEKLRRGVLTENTARRSETEDQVHLRFAEALATCGAQEESLQLDRISTALADRLVSTLQPHLHRLVEMAQFFNPGGSIHFSHQNLSSELSGTIKRSLQLKLELLRLEIRHTFFWPSNGDLFDTKVMKHQYDQNPQLQHEVAFTSFPGLRVDLMSGSKTNVVRHADVVSRTLPTRKDDRLTISHLLADSMNSQSRASSSRNSLEAMTKQTTRTVRRSQRLESALETGSCSSLRSSQIRFPPTSSLDEPGRNLVVKPLKDSKPLDLSSDPERKSLHPQELQAASTLRISCAKYLEIKRKFFALKAQLQAKRQPFRSTSTKRMGGIDNAKLFALWRAYKDVGWLDDKWSNGLVSTEQE